MKIRKNDNPYQLVIYDEKYFVKFKDNKNAIYLINISKNVYDAFNKFKLEDISQMHKYERHIEHSELYEETLYRRIKNKEMSVEDIVFRKILYDNLYTSINCLSRVQRKRLIMYYFYDITLKEIAELENCSIHSIYISLVRSRQKLTKNLKFSVKN